MKIFQLWLVLNSCIFMMVYFLSFLILKYSWKRSLLICMLATTVSMLLEIYRVNFVFESAWHKIGISIIQIPILQAAALILSKVKNSYALFIGFSSSNFVLAGNILSCAVLLLSDNCPAAMAVCTIANAVVFLFMDRMIKDICIQMLSKEISIWMCVIPAMCYITFYLMLYFPVSFEKNPESMLSAASLLATVIVMYILLIQYINAKSSKKNLAWRNKELHAYIRGIAFQSDAAQTAIQDIRIMRHDMRHKDQLLISLLQNGNYSEAEQMIYQDIEYLEKPYLVMYCENIVLNSILCSMAKKAEQMGIDLQISCTMPKQQEMNDYDLAMIIANLLENAIHAVAKLEKKERYVILTLKNRNGERFFMETQNPCHEAIRFSKKTGLPLSGNGEGHGFGMTSIQKFLKKYNAHFDCFTKNGMFTFRILIDFL